MSFDIWYDIKWDGILLSYSKRSEFLMNATIGMNSKDFMLSERGQFHKNIHCMAPFMEHSGEGETQ